MVLLAGYFHGHLPFGLSQVMIFIQMNGTVYLIGLFQFFLFAKAVMIFKRSWMDELDEAPDSWVIGFSGSFAMVYTFIRLMGDFLASRSGYTPQIAKLRSQPRRPHSAHDLTHHE